MKDKMRATIKILRDSGCNLILVAHVDEKGDEDRLVKRPMIMTKLSDELVNMVDVVGYMTVVQQDGEDKRIIVVDPTNDKYVAKDRTGQLGKYIPPNFSEILKACQGTERYAWSAPEAKKAAVEAPDAPKTTPAPETAKETDGVKKSAVSEKLAKAGAKKPVAKKKVDTEQMDGPGKGENGDYSGMD